MEVEDLCLLAVAAAGGRWRQSRPGGAGGGGRSPRQIVSGFGGRGGRARGGGGGGGGGVLGAGESLCAGGRAAACQSRREVMSGDAPVNAGAVTWPDPYPAGAAVRSMQVKLHRWAGEDSSRRFGDLFNLVYDPAFLVHARERVPANRGAGTPGTDKAPVAGIETWRTMQNPATWRRRGRSATCKGGGLHNAPGSGSRLS